MLAKGESSRGKQVKAFDWVRAAEIIKAKLAEDSGIKVEAGLCGDWEYTGGPIFSNGVPDMEGYTYLASGWATPAMIITSSNGDEIEIPCFETEGRYDSDSKWPEEALQILNQKALES